MTTVSQPPCILLIGVTGQIGGELAKALRPLGEVVVAARKQIRGLYSGFVHPIDLSDLRGIRSLMREVRPTLVINAAGFHHVNEAEGDAATAEAVNAVAPSILAEESLRIGEGLVHFSTSYVFDGRGHRPWREDDPPAPVNVFGRTKLAGEQAIQASGVPHMILRTSWTYAPQGRNFVHAMLLEGFEHEIIDAIDDQIGSPTPAKVIAELTAQLLTQANGDFLGWLAQHGGVVHLACRGETSWHDFAEAIFLLAQASGMPLRVKHVVPVQSSEYPTAAVRPMNSRLDLSRLAVNYGLNPPEWYEALVAEFPRILAVVQSPAMQKTEVWC